MTFPPPLLYSLRVTVVEYKALRECVNLQVGENAEGGLD
jgi:hypothetical protein